jgi:hypothetical protein
MDLYSGSNPNTGTLLGSSTAPAGYGTNEVTFNFDEFLVPTTVTFILSLPDQNGSYDSIFLYPVLTSGAAPTVGSGVNSLWYGNGPGTFIANPLYAENDGADTNFLNVQFNATVPELGFYAAFALNIGGLLLFGIRRRRST